MQTGQTLWITLAVIALVLARFLFRELRVRRIKTAAIFSIPIITGIIAAFLVYSVVSAAPDQITSLTIGGMVAVVVGIAIGLAVAHFTTVRVAEPGVLLVRGSWVTVGIWVAALALRWLARSFVPGGSTVIYSSAASTAGPSLMLNAVLVIMVVAALTTVRVRMLAVSREIPPDTPIRAA
jgi:hypothetical protein